HSPRAFPSLHSHTHSAHSPPRGTLIEPDDPRCGGYRVVTDARATSTGCRILCACRAGRAELRRCARHRDGVSRRFRSLAEAAGRDPTTLTLSAMFFVQLAETSAEAERLRAVLAACYGLAPHDAADHHPSWSAFPVPLGPPPGRGGGPQASRRRACRQLR